MSTKAYPRATILHFRHPLGRPRVGSVTSVSDAVNKLNAFVVDSAPKHDLSTESWLAMWSANVPGGASGKADKGIIADLLNRIDACALSKGCAWTADQLFATMNREQYLPADNGLMSFGQMMTLLNRYPVNADDPPGVTLTPADVPGVPDPEVVSDEDRANAAMTDADIRDACFAAFGSALDMLSHPTAVIDCANARAKLRDDAKAKIDRLGSGFMVSPDIAPRKPINVMVSPDIAPAKPKKATTTAVLEEAAADAPIAAPIVLGGLGAIFYGLRGAVIGVVAGLAVAGAAGVWLRRRMAA